MPCEVCSSKTRGVRVGVYKCNEFILGRETGICRRVCCVQYKRNGLLIVTFLNGGGVGGRWG